MSVLSAAVTIEMLEAGAAFLGRRRSVGKGAAVFVFSSQSLSERR